MNFEKLVIADASKYSSIVWVLTSDMMNEHHANRSALLKKMASA